MPPNPLHNLTQVIHVDSHKFLFHSTVSGKSSKQKWNLWLFALDNDSRGDVIAWNVQLDLKEAQGEEDALATAAKGGYLHVSATDESSSDQILEQDELQLSFIMPQTPAVPFILKTTEEAATSSVLLNAAFTLLEPQSGSTQASEIKRLQAALTEKEIEIGHLNAKLASARANVARASANDKHGSQVSPQKKVPANASALQPNQKRRKAVEDEFAGSDDEDDDD